MAISDIVEYEIRMEAKQAIQELIELNNKAQDFGTKVDNVRAAIQRIADNAGMGFRQVAMVMKEADAEVASLVYDGVALTENQGVFNSMAKEGWSQVASGAREAGGMIDIVSVAVGTLTSRLVYGLFNAIRDTFTQAITLANDYAKAIYQVGVAQDILSRGGISITQQDMLDMAKAIEKEFGVFSDVQMTKAVSQASLLTREFGFTKDQIGQVVQMGAALAIQQGDLKNINNYIEQITRAITAGNAPAALSKLGIDVTANQVKELGAEMYGVNHTLTDQEKNVVTLALAYQHMNSEIQDFSSYQDTLPGKADKLSASWQDLLKNAGTAINPIKSGLIDIANWFISSVDWMRQFSANIMTYVIAPFVVLQEVHQNNIHSFEDLKTAWTTAVSSLNAGLKAAGGGVTDLSNATNTAIDNTNSLNSALVDTSKLDLSSLTNQITSLADQMDKTTRNFITSQQNAEADYYTKSARDYQDYQLKRNQTIADGKAKEADINAKHHAAETDAEAKFQEKMRQLREKYLFDLEDALRARDAKQVIRLMEKYQMDKTNAENEFALQHKTETTRQAQELAAAKKATDDKLAQDDAAFKLKEARATEDYNTSHNRAVAAYLQQLADQRKAWDEKLQMEAQKLGDQYGLNADQVNKLYQLLSSYYGPQGKMDGLYDYSYKSLVARSQALLNGIVAAINAANQALASVGTVLPGVVASEKGKFFGGSSSQGGGPTHASGGIDIVNTPTQTNYGATYGEAGAEAHIFLPLTNTPSMPSVSSIGGGGSGGKMGLDITLSPDLVARVTENTMNQVAVTINKVRRSK